MRLNRPTTVGAVVLILVAAALFAAVGPVAADTAQEDRLELVVHDDGSAQLTLFLVYDLDDEQDADGFDSIADDEAAQDELRDRFEARMTTVAEDTSARVDRDVSVSGAEIDLERDDGVGTVRLSITVTNLLAVDDGTLVLTEPFSSGFDVDGQFHVVVPDGHAVTDVHPSPTETDDQRLVWGPDVDLTGFELVLTAEDDPTDGIPGFGIGVALLGLLGVGVFLKRRR